MSPRRFHPVSNRQPALPHSEEVLTVSQLTRDVKRIIEGAFDFVYVAGEVSNLRRPPSGHLYFTLKDEGAQLAVVMFRREAASVSEGLEEGLSVICTGRLSVYEPRGNYQLIATRLEIKGTGALELRFRKLVEKLSKEGLFDPARKRPIPLLPHRVGIITSSAGAAIIDILRVFNRRFPRVHATLFPASVQGDAAAGEIVEAIRKANTFPDIDVLIVARGGGSLEDLWPFNEEIVARAVAASSIPVVSGVGHEVDVTICDLVADLRAATPTAAAEAVVPKETDLRAQLAQARDRLRRLLSARLEHADALVSGLARSVRPETLLRQLESREQRLDDLYTIARNHLRGMLALLDRHLEGVFGKVTSLDPLAVLGRGYSVTMDERSGAILRDASEAKVGQGIVTRLSRGELRSDVKSVRKGNEP